MYDYVLFIIGDADWRAADICELFTILGLPT